jgi:hypothetical protein
MELPLKSFTVTEGILNPLCAETKMGKAKNANTSNFFMRV